MGIPRQAFYLEARPFSGVLLVVTHGVEDLLVAPGHQAHGPQHLQHRHLRLQVVCGQALRYDVDARRVGQHVRPPLL